MHKVFFGCLLLLPAFAGAQVEDPIRIIRPDTVKPRPRPDSLRRDTLDYWRDTIAPPRVRYLKDGEFESDTVSRASARRKKFKFRYSDRIQYTAFLDWPLTTGAGVPGSLLLQKALTNWQEELIPQRDWSLDSTAAQQRRSVYRRLARILLLDATVESIVMGVQQDAFGHYARVRELGIPGIGYGLAIPIPLWIPWGKTSYTLPGLDASASRQELSQIAGAAYEAGGMAGDELTVRWLRRRGVFYREALHYLRIQTAAMASIFTASNTPGTGATGIENWLYFANREYGHISEYGYTAGTLKRDYAIATFTNPTLYTSVLAVFRDYLLQGRDSVPMNAIRLGYGKMLLPWVRLSLTPFGPEWVPELTSTWHRRAINMYGRINSGVFQESYGGGFKLYNLLRKTTYGINLHASLWKQSYFYRGWINQEAEPVGWGGAAVVTGYFRLSKSNPNSLSLAVEAGYKTRGYMEGEVWKAAPIIKVGLSWTLDRDYEQDDTVPEYEEVLPKKKTSRSSKKKKSKKKKPAAGNSPQKQP